MSFGDVLKVRTLLHQCAHRRAVCGAAQHSHTVHVAAICIVSSQVFFAILLMALGISQSQMVGFERGPYSPLATALLREFVASTWKSDLAHLVTVNWQAFPDVSKAKSSIQNVFTLIDSRPKNIDIDAPGETRDTS
jgi:hypothetical protein